MSNRNYRLPSPIIIDTITSTGTLTIDTGGSFALNIGGTNAVSISLGHSGVITTSLGPLTVNQDSTFLGTNFTVDSSVINLGDASTDVINTIAAIATSVPFGAVGSTGNFSVYALQQSNALAVGSQMTYTSGIGGNGSGSNAGGNGGASSFLAANGGNGTATAAAGVGGALTVRAGSAGTNNGGGGANGGDLVVDAGAKSGAGIDGYVYVGTANGQAVHIGKAAKTIFVDGYLQVDGYANLSHDIGFTDSLALTQQANTTTGANLRLRKIRFFSDNIPTSQAPQSIYATGGDLVLSSPSQNIMIDASEIYWAQNAQIYSGGFNMQIGPAQNYLKMNYDITNASIGYDLVGTGTGGSVGDNTLFRLSDTTNYTASGVDLRLVYIKLTNNTDDGYTGSATGLHVDLSAGTNTSFPKTTLKQKAHSAYTGSEYVTTTASAHTTNATQFTAWSYTLSDNTLYWFQIFVIGRDAAGTERAMYGKKALVYRQSAGSATIQGTVQDTHPDVETSAGLDATLTVNSNDVRLSVTGLASTTINWVATITYQAVATNT